MRIHDQNPAGGLPGVNAGVAGTSGSAGSAGVAGSVGQGGQVKGGEQTGQGPDRVSLSNLAASLRPEAPDREAELERLSELFNSGVYEPDPRAVAENLIEEGLMTPPEEAESGSGERG